MSIVLENEPDFKVSPMNRVTAIAKVKNTVPGALAPFEPIIIQIRFVPHRRDRSRKA
jgi:hypothetical protein